MHKLNCETLEAGLQLLQQKPRLWGWQYLEQDRFAKYDKEQETHAYRLE